MANIELPEDAEGRGIPPDTAFPYDDDGRAHGVRTHRRAVDGDMPDRKWEALPFSRGKAGMGIECPNCGGRAVRTDGGDVFVCEKGRPLMREARYRCRHCGSTVIFLGRCEPEGGRP